MLAVAKAVENWGTNTEWGGDSSFESFTVSISGR